MSSDKKNFYDVKNEALNLTFEFEITRIIYLKDKNNFETKYFFTWC